MGRREARENAFRLIYERITTGEKNALTFDLLKANCADETAYLETVYGGVCEKLDFLSALIAKYAAGFSAARIYKVDMSVLLLSAYEILFMDNVPDKVSVNEALELSKIYSTDKSAAFINGILASVIQNKASILSGDEENSESETD